MTGELTPRPRRPRPDRNVELRERILRLAQRHKRYGVGMIYLKLRQAVLPVNYKRVERLYQEAKLQARRRQRKKVALGEWQPLLRTALANEVWSMDFVFNRTAEARVIKCLTIVDDATHESVAFEVERAISGCGVSRVLDRLAISRGLPKVIRADNGKEFCRKVMVIWAHERGVQLRLIEPACRTRTPTSIRSTDACATNASTKTGSPACCMHAPRSRHGVVHTTRSDRKRRWADCHRRPMQSRWRQHQSRTSNAEKHHPVTTNPPDDVPNPLALLLPESDALYGDIKEALSSFELHEPDSRELATIALCQVAFEHGAALRGLIANGLAISGVALLRVQFEALVRAVWVLHVATDAQVDRLTAPLTPEGEQGAKNLPSILRMIEGVEKSGPPGSGQMFRRFHDRLSNGLNSFVHAGIHAIHRQLAPYPIPLLCDVVKNSNAVAMLTVIVMSELAHNGQELVMRYSGLHERHAASLPTLEPFTNACPAPTSEEP